MVCEVTIEEADLSPEQIRGVILAGGSTRIPLVRRSIEEIFEQSPIIDTANVDEVVSLGAALYAGYRNHDQLTPIQIFALARLDVSEVTNKNYGTAAVSRDELTGEYNRENSIIIKKGTRIPHKQTETYFTMYPNQQSVNCWVTECDREEKDLTFVEVVAKKKLELPELEGGRAAGSKILITYSYNANQVMECEFLDTETGEREQVRIDFMKRGD